MDDVSLRAYTPADRDALWPLKRAFELSLGEGDEQKAATYERKLTDEYRERWLDWADRCVTDDPGCITLATDGDDPVGYLFLLPADLAFIWDAAVVNELYLAPAYRGSGVADDLMDAALDHAREQALPLERVVLDVDPENGRAYAFYEKCGYEPWADLVARDI